MNETTTSFLPPLFTSVLLLSLELMTPLYLIRDFICYFLFKVSLPKGEHVENEFPVNLHASVRISESSVALFLYYKVLQVGSFTS